MTTIGRLFIVGQAAFFFLACGPMNDRVPDSGAPAGGAAEARVEGMHVQFDCELRLLSATFSWRLSGDHTPTSQALEVSLFRDQWDPAADAVQVRRAEPGISQVVLPLETDSVYYWRVRVNLPDRMITSAIEQIQTPNCVADFVNDG